jgi:NRPS condensation-like uncharacterized protein
MFSGNLDCQILTAALTRTIPRHPLLTARVVQDRSRPCWQLQENGLPEIQWQMQAAGDCFAQTPFLNLKSESGIRLIVNKAAESTCVLIQFHHACCDGLGIMEFVSQLLLEYRCLANHQNTELKTPSINAGTSVDAGNSVSCELIRRRGRTGLNLRDVWRLLPAHVKGIRRPWSFLTRPAMPLLTGRKSQASPPQDSAPGIVQRKIISRRFTADESRNYLEGAKRHSVSTNDLLMRDVFLVIHQLRSTHGINDCGEWTRLLIPMSYRPQQLNETFATNYTTMIFVDRRGADFVDENSLLRGLRAEMQQIKRDQLGYSFLLALTLSRHLPGGLRRFAGGRRCDVTAVMTNLGRILAFPGETEPCGRLRLGRALLETVDVAAPITPMTDVSVSIANYAGQLSVSLHFNESTVSELQAREFLQLLATRTTMHK